LPRLQAPQGLRRPAQQRAFRAPRPPARLPALPPAPARPPAPQIITFVYDDVAGDSNNPFPGQLFNAPTPAGEAGEDVYAGCVTPGATYTGGNVTVANFLAVLTGNASAATGPVLRSDASSKVFVNLVDHGGAGLFAFPSELLYADALHGAMDAMTAAGMYSELVFYLESCESGSMFRDILPNSTRVYAATASLPDESSWGTYCPGDPDAPGASAVNGTDLQTCLGDLFSVSWMEAVFQNCSLGEGARRCTESLALNFNITSAWTNLSSPQQYGDLRFQAAPVGGWVSSGRAPFPPAPAPARGGAPRPPPGAGAVSARAATAASLQARGPGDARARRELGRMAALEQRQGAAFDALARGVARAPSAGAAAFPRRFAEWACYREANALVDYTDASLGLAKVAAAACAADPKGAPAALAAACADAGGCKAAA
jgi:legumain